MITHNNSYMAIGGVFIPRASFTSIKRLDSLRDNQVAVQGAGEENLRFYTQPSSFLVAMIYSRYLDRVWRSGGISSFEQLAFYSSIFSRPTYIISHSKFLQAII